MPKLKGFMDYRNLEENAATTPKIVHISKNSKKWPWGRGVGGCGGSKGAYFSATAFIGEVLVVCGLEQRIFQEIL